MCPRSKGWDKAKVKKASYVSQLFFALHKWHENYLKKLFISPKLFEVHQRLRVCLSWTSDLLKLTEIGCTKPKGFPRTDVAALLPHNLALRRIVEIVCTIAEQRALPPYLTVKRCIHRTLQSTKPHTHKRETVTNCVTPCQEIAKTQKGTANDALSRAAEFESKPEMESVDADRCGHSPSQNWSRQNHTDSDSGKEPQTVYVSSGQ